MPKPKKPAIPLARVIMMSVFFGIAYFIFLWQTEGVSWRGIIQTLLGMALFAGFYYLFGVLLRKFVK